MTDILKAPLESNKIKNIAIELLIILSGVLLFALSFPSFLYRWGFPFLSYFCLVPVFWLIHRIGYVKSIIFGGIYGYLSYALFNYWLAVFNPLSFIFVPVIYMVYFMIVFPFLKLADSVFPKYGFILQVLVWISFEYIRTTGFLGYSYGILGYSQYNFTSLIGIADMTGVAGVSLLVVWPSAIMAHALRDGIKGFRGNLRDNILPSSVWLILFIAALLYSNFSKVDYSQSRVWKTALIQHNLDSWRKGLEVNKEAVDIMIRLTEEAKTHDPDVVIWSETAYVPSIEYHLKYRNNREKVELTQKVMNYIDSLNIPVILGNNDTILHRTFTEDYNAMLLTDGKTIFDKYRKMHLVPFSEHFPYGDIFPRIDQIIRDSKASRFDAGSEYTIFDLDGIKFGGLICFEDTFGYISRGLVQGEAQVLVNITNDLWSREPISCIQHMGMAVFRSIENRRSMVRSTNGGFTTVIDPNGKRISELEPLTENFLIEDVPVYDGKTTIFTLWGHWFDYLVISLTILGFAFGILRVALGWKRKNRSLN